MSLTQALGLYSTEKWESLGDRLRSDFQLQPTESVRPYKGLGPSAFEISLSLAQFFAHKRAIGFCKGFSPWIDELHPYFIKEAYQIQNLDPSHFLKMADRGEGDQTSSLVQDWVQSLKKDTLFVVACEDHPITGEVYDLSALDQQLNDKKIFFIRLSSRPAGKGPVRLGEYSIRLFSYGSDLALGFFGSKCKALGIFSNKMFWSDDDLNSSKLYMSPSEQVDDVDRFEKELSQFRFQFQISSRLKDRLVLIFPEVSADRMMKSLSQNLELQKELGFNSSDIQNQLWSANSCFQDSHLVEWKWWFQGPSVSQRRDLLLIGTELLKSKKLVALLQSTYQSLKAEQTWSY